MATPGGFGFEGKHYTITYYDGYPSNFLPDIRFAYKVFGWQKLKGIIMNNKKGYRKLSSAGTYLMCILVKSDPKSKRYVSSFLDSLDYFRKGDIGEPNDFIVDPVIKTVEETFNIGAEYVYKLSQSNIVYNSAFAGKLDTSEKWDKDLFNKRNIVERLFELGIT